MYQGLEEECKCVHIQNHNVSRVSSERRKNNYNQEKHGIGRSPLPPPPSSKIQPIYHPGAQNHRLVLQIPEVFPSRIPKQ